MNKKILGQKIRLVYIHEPESPGCVEIFSDPDAWNIKIVHDLASGVDSIQTFKPDAVMMDSSFMVTLEHELNKNIKDLFLKLKDGTIRPKPAVAAIFPSDPGPDIRSLVLSAGCDDFFILPVLLTEFQLKMGMHIDRADLNQRVLWEKKRVITAFKRLDEFKLEFIKMKKDFAEEKNFLHNSLKQISIMTLERNKLRSRLHDLERKFQKNIKWIEFFLTRMIESRNENNKGHSRRVADIAVFVAKGLNLKKNDRKIVKKAGMLHEFGMIFIPDSIFSKEKKALSEYEKDMIAQSPVRGADILEKCTGFKKVAEVIRHINENVDGSGLPNGLKRRYIPIMSRIIAGADMLDMLLNENAGMSRDDIFVKLEAAAGQRLDPNIINYLERYVVICLNKEFGKTREVGLHQLKPGMRTGAGLFTSTGTKLFSAGTVLTEEFINMVIRYNKVYPVRENVIIKAE